MQRSTLELHWRVRAGGGGSTERRYLDFVVDGASLLDRLRGPDLVSGLGCWPSEFEHESLRQLLAQAPGASPSGRVPLYVCGECGDLGCGAITAIVERTPAGFAWRDFAFENDYDDASHRVIEANGGVLVERFLAPWYGPGERLRFRIYLD